VGRTSGIHDAEAEIGRLQSLEDKLKGNDTYWANQVEAQRLAAAGILAHVRGDDKTAVREDASIGGKDRKAREVPCEAGPAHRVIPKSRFSTLDTIEEVIQKLIGI
jgi:hypothetical protein